MVGFRSNLSPELALVTVLLYRRTMQLGLGILPLPRLLGTQLPPLLRLEGIPPLPCLQVVGQILPELQAQLSVFPDFY